MQLKSLTLYIILNLIVGISLVGQSTCTESLLSAQRLYNEGIIEEIPNIINPCLEDGFTSSERIEAFKLLILAYLFDDNQFEAENTILEFLRQFPDYELMPNDPIEFVYFYKTFSVIPKYSFGFSAGSNISNPHVIQNYTTGNPDQLVSDDKSGFGYDLSVNFTMYRKGRYGFNAQVMFGSKKYTFEDKVSDFTKTTIEETLNQLSVPLSFTIDFPKDKITPYIRAGAGMTYLLDAFSTPTRAFINFNESDFSGADIHLLTHRQKFNVNIFSGGGVKIPSGKGFIFLDIRYNYSLFNPILDDKRFENQELWSKYYYIEDDFRLQSFEVAAGYNFTIFKAIKN